MPIRRVDRPSLSDTCVSVPPRGHPMSFDSIHSWTRFLSIVLLGSIKPWSGDSTRPRRARADRPYSRDGKGVSVRLLGGACGLLAVILADNRYWPGAASHEAALK